jgi:hypothetical protein
LRKVADSNFLRLPELRDYLSASRTNFVIITDYAEMEALKGNALVNIFRSTEIIAEHPKQVLLLKTTDIVSGLKGKKKGLKKRITDGKRTTAFRKWCLKRERAKNGDKRLQRQIIQAGEEAEAHFDRMLEGLACFGENLEDAAKHFTQDELRVLRNREQLPPELVDTIIGRIMDLARRLFTAHPSIAALPASKELPYTYVFRFALCAYLHALRWMVAGGVHHAPRERIRNDLVDVSFAAYATCFDGLLSKDNMCNEIYENANFLLKHGFLKGE